MGLLGRLLFWPGLRERGEREPLATRIGAATRRGVAGATSHRAVAIPLVVLAAAALVFVSTGLAHISLALTPIRGLAASTPPQRAAAAAAQGFAPGMLAPTEVVVEAPGIARRREELRRLGRALRARPETAAVIGAGVTPLPRRFQPIFSSRTGGAVRYFVALRDHPYSSAAIADLSRLERDMPQLLQTSGLTGARVLYAGDTALAKETVTRITHDLLWVGLAAAAVNLVLLALFLRAIVAPFLLVASSMLAITATFGLTTYVFRDLFGTQDLTYFVPLAVGVLLLSFGTDYNLFVVGRIWQEAKVRDTREAIRVAVPRASRAISIAGIALAGSFATLALIPIAPFREFAVAVGAGVLIDTFLVRTLLIPALLSGVGNASWWPGRRARRDGPLEMAAPAAPTSARRSLRPREPRGTWSG
jgi:RND superfamily putative drug exporter